LEHRSAARVRAVLKAEIRYNDGLMSTPCLVRDLSETGARLELEGDVALPDRFDLYIEKKHRIRRAIMKRRQGRDVGVAFDDVEAKPLPAGNGLAQRVSKLEVEIAELRRLLEKIAAAVAPRE
jgi:hypothetical protein